MAKVAAVVACSHSPYLYDTPETWDASRQRRRLGQNVPLDPPEVNQAKHARCMKAFAKLRERVEAARPDVLLVFGDDQYEQFHFDNFPAFALCLSNGFEAMDPAVFCSAFMRRGEILKSSEQRVKGRGCPELGKELMVGLMERGFDLAFSLDLPNAEYGLGHAFTHPSYYLDPGYTIPILPFYVNCYYPPQPSGRRCYELGRAVREEIEACPLDLNVVVVGSGGLWHTPLWPDAYLDEAFDGAILDYVRAGDAAGMAQFFDGVPWRHPDTVRPGLEWIIGVTGMRGGIGSGTGETRNWIAAAAVADGTKGTVADYVPVYASPCGMGFAYWDQP